MRILSGFFNGLLFLAALTALFCQKSLAYDKFSGTNERYVSVRLLPETNRVEAGQLFWVGIEQSIAKGWHTYWINPGDSGTHPIITWQLPEGFTVEGEVQWPAPEKIPYGPLMNYGYSDKVMLLQQIRAPFSLNEGPKELSAKIEILVCKDICIPETSVVKTILNEAGTEIADNRAYLAQAMEKLPQQKPWESRFAREGDQFVLRVSAAVTEDQQAADLSSADPAGVSLFPVEWGLVDNTAAPQTEIKLGPDQNMTLVLRQKAGDRKFAEVSSLPAVLAYPDQAGVTRFVQLNASPEGLSAVKDMAEGTLAGALLLALAGGLILNLTPCVFPVLSIKALGPVKIAQKEPQIARLQGVSYTAGVVLSFVAVAALLIGLKSAGAEIGWGFQLQDPLVVGFLAYLLFIIGLNLSGFFDMGAGLGNLGGKLAAGQSYASSFFTGVLATLVAAPCTAPFMAGAIGYALVQPPLQALLVFAALGFGLALPYLALSLLPALQKLLPKPGGWMEALRQFLAFPMLASAIWLVWVLSLQTGSGGVLMILSGMLALGMGIWLFKQKPRRTKSRFVVRLLGILSLLLAMGGFLPLAAIKNMPPENTRSSEAKEQSFGEPFSEARLSEVIAGPDPVFVEMTAAWCITCKINHAVALNIESTKALFAGARVQYLVGDWTDQNPEITAYLKKYGRSGVPLYIYYGPRDPATGQRPEAVVLPQLLTPEIVAGIVGR